MRGLNECPSSLNSCLSLVQIARRKSETGNRSENRERQRIFLYYGRTAFVVRPLEQPVRSVRYRSATHVISSAQARHTRVAQLVCTLLRPAPCECRRSAAFILAGPVYNNALKNCAALLCRTQRRVARMCSSTLSVNCEYFMK